MALLEARRLVKQYGKRMVVSGVDIDVHAGEVCGLLGANGAGKTTSFRMMVGMIPPKSGTVRFNGVDVTHMAMYKRARLGMGYLAQETSVFRRLTVEQNLQAILELMTVRQGKPFYMTRSQQRNRIDELLEKFGLTRLRKSIASTLSGGERRRLEIARCLISEPLLIMLDEPFTGIDPRTVEDIQHVILGLRNEGIGVLITDHHVLETLRITDRSYIVAHGQMLTHGTPVDIINDQRVRDAYLGNNISVAALGESYLQRQQEAERQRGHSQPGPASVPYAPPGTGSWPPSPPPQPPAPSPSYPGTPYPGAPGPGYGGPSHAGPPMMPPPAPPQPVRQAPVGGPPIAGSVRSLLDNEEIYQLIHRLGEGDGALAAAQLRARGGAAIVPLIHALERREPILRARAHLLLCEITGYALVFQPDAPDHIRLQQIAVIRAQLEHRQAG